MAKSSSVFGSGSSGFGSFQTVRHQLPFCTGYAIFGALPGAGVYGLAVSVTYQPSPGAQYGAATMLYAIVDEQGGVTLTRQDPNAVKLRGMTLMELARYFLEMEQDDALNALEQTQKTSRNASPRLAAYLLIDAAL